MTHPTTLLVAGDTHGDNLHIHYLYDIALETGSDAILIVGDYGYWEHQWGGAEFLDLCSHLATQNATPLYWIDGNHECHSLLRSRYGPGGELHQPTPEGFWEIREGVYYIPRGTRWVWSDKHLMGLGGAYSVDKFSRLDAERNAYRTHVEANAHRVKAGAPTRPFNLSDHQRWWAEEELTDADVAVALTDRTPLDILFTHDKPRASNPRWNRKDFDDCYPNEDKIQTVVRTLQPRLLIHGHLHYRYTDFIRCGDDGKTTHVEGLNCNPFSREHRDNSDPGTSWIVLHLTENAEDDKEE